MLFGVLTREHHNFFTVKNYDASFTVAAQSRNATEFSRTQLQQLSIRDVKRAVFDRLSLSGFKHHPYQVEHL
jgi:hypothetical protein